MRPLLKSLLNLLGVLSVSALLGCAPSATKSESSFESINDCRTEFIVLGTGQDGGAPQISHPNDPAWKDKSLRLWAASGALVDHENGERFLFEATPDMREQLNLLDNLAPGKTGPLGLSGIFLTHAHIGHYTGLIFAGHESAGAKNLRVFAMPRMKTYLESNGPWDQLVRYGNIAISPLQDKTPALTPSDLSVTPYRVPHRDEYSETVGYVINGPSKSILFLPDIDDWDRWSAEYGTLVEDMIAAVDIAYLDATFFDNNELPGRDMSQIPHPRVVDSMTRFSLLPAAEQAKVRFFHLNHTNKARFKTSAEYKSVIDAGFTIAKRGDRVCLD